MLWNGIGAPIGSGGTEITADPTLPPLTSYAGTYGFFAYVNVGGPTDCMVDGASFSLTNLLTGTGSFLTPWGWIVACAYGGAASITCL